MVSTLMVIFCRTLTNGLGVPNWNSQILCTHLFSLGVWAAPLSMVPSKVQGIIGVIISYVPQTGEVVLRGSDVTHFNAVALLVYGGSCGCTVPGFATQSMHVYLQRQKVLRADLHPSPVPTGTYRLLHQHLQPLGWQQLFLYNLHCGTRSECKRITLKWNCSTFSLFLSIIICCKVCLPAHTSSSVGTLASPTTTLAVIFWEYMARGKVPTRVIRLNVAMAPHLHPKVGSTCNTIPPPPPCPQVANHKDVLHLPGEAPEVMNVLHCINAPS